eukprot:CAMPEP_0184644366 /NCGR_PEP_ID=MMETSP0308-20130426/1091_1 /TAXON_ID=38269 /ORGANISM="Gloeochaete witrockiana, Strain SAG 46.84" /LENGTH=75 /DNA_ID=CAMNT_0027072847 /DNA_START=445 /DNA_END=672 /DNA_ORIENTATION=+
MLMSRMNESRGGALIALDDEILKDEFLIAEKWRRKALLIAIENLKYKDENITEKTIRELLAVVESEEIQGIGGSS